VTTAVSFSSTCATAKVWLKSCVIRTSPPGLFDLELRAPEAAPWKELLLLPPGQILDLGEVVLAPPVSLGGTALLPDGEPARNLSLQWVAYREEVHAGEAWPRWLRTDQNGSFLIEDLRPGRYRLFPVAEGIAMNPILVDVSRGSRRDLVWQLQGGVPLAIRLTSRTESPAFGVVLDGNGHPVGRQIPANRLAAEITLLPGPYLLRAYTPDGQVLRELPFTVPSEDGDLDIVLP